VLLYQLFITGFIHIRWLDIVDIVMVAFLLYGLYNFLRGTVAFNIFIGIVAVFLIWKVVDVLEMELLSDILGAFISVGFIALIVIFQPEIRKFLLAVGTPTYLKRRKGKFLFWDITFGNESTPDVDAIIMACQKMSDSKEGALIVIARQNELRSFSETGEIINSRISTLLIENIFFKNSPLHDGAMIIYQNRIVAAGCILPVSNKADMPKRLGLRHRAAVGITELSDAVSIVVSEQTGSIAYCKGGQISLRVKPAQLKDKLEAELGLVTNTQEEEEM